MQRARAAQTAWAQMPMAARTRILHRLRREIAARRDQIVETLCHETGKPPLDALAGDVMVTLEQMRFYEKHAARLLKRRSVGKPAMLYTGAWFYEQYEPYGVALIFAPANYPFQLAVVPVISALFAGNAAILKCSEKTPQIAALVASLCADTLPADLVQVTDDAPQSAAALIDAAPDIVFFTGSSQNGRAVATRAAGLLIPTVLELGGKDAAVVFADCDLARTVEGISYGAFSNAGQVCVGTKRVYVEQPIYAKFIDELTARVGRLRVGSSSDADLGILPAEAARSNLASQIQDALDRGATLHSPPGESLTGKIPVVLSDVSPHAGLIANETFGPVVCVAPFRSESEAIALANSTPFALSASVWTRDIARGRRIASAMTAGSCAVNDVIRNIANPHASFGGNGHSGYGRYHGPQGLYAFSRIKSVMVTRSRSTHAIHWFPFSRETFTRLNALLALRHRPSEWRSALRRLFLPLLLCVLASPQLLAQSSEEAHLRITVVNAGDTKGAIAFLVFASPDGFPNDKSKALRSGFEPAAGSGQETTFDAGPLNPGRYAVSVYQDVNGNHKLDMNFFGIPREPVGASNNPRPGFGPPRFNQCAFQFDHTDETISISLVNPR